MRRKQSNFPMVMVQDDPISIFLRDEKNFLQNTCGEKTFKRSPSNCKRFESQMLPDQ